MGEVGGDLTLAARPTTLAPASTGSDPDPDPAPPTHTSRRNRLRFWQSPPGQPSWARPTLLAIAALAALSYGWGMSGDLVETFYAGAARSMSQGWGNFFFGAFDPWGTVSVDKLPGSLWIQALSLRVFGFHLWALVLPQVVEGTLTVLVLYRAVRRVAGTTAGLIAATALAVTPVTVLLNRGNISDSLLILLLVLAADATTDAYMTGRLRPLVLAGVYVGLAFQAKMLQAWIVLPAIYIAYLMAAPALSVARRYKHVAISAVVALAVSLSWMCVVTLVPAHDRPYVDGSCNNSVFSQVFLYNGADRLTGKVLDQPGCNPPPAAVQSQSSTTGGAPTAALENGPSRFLAGPLGRDAAWLFIPAVVALGSILFARRRRPRTDPWRAAAVLWGTWMIFTWAFFADSKFLNDYYLAALAPPMAALIGLGLVLAWRMRSESPAVPVVLGATVVATVAEALSLTPRSAGVWIWVLVTTLALAASAGSCIVLWRRAATPPPWAAGAGFALAAAAVLVGAAWASGTAVASRLGPFDTPYQPASATTAEHAGWQRDMAHWTTQAAAAATVPAERSIETAETSAQVSQDVLATGHEYLPVGGFSGQVPSTPLATFVHWVGAGRIHSTLVATRPTTRNPDMRWALAHCARTATTTDNDGRTYRTYICTPGDARP